MNKYVLLDRDGVINYDSDNYIKSPDEFIIMPESIKALSMLYKNGYKIIVITNQSGINRGYYTKDTLDNIHKKLSDELDKHQVKIEKIYYCPHIPEEDCKCRKPSPKLLLQAIEEYNIDTSNLFFVGDKLSDIQAGLSAGIKTALVLTGKGAKTLQKHKQEIEQPTKSFANLLEFSQFLLGPGVP